MFFYICILSSKLYIKYIYLDKLFLFLYLYWYYYIILYACILYYYIDDDDDDDIRCIKHYNRFM